MGLPGVSAPLDEFDSSSRAHKPALGLSEANPGCSCIFGIAQNASYQTEGHFFPHLVNRLVKFCAGLTLRSIVFVMVSDASLAP